MSAQTLRHYQNTAIHAVFDAFDMDYRRILYTVCTGGGKTTIFAELTKIFLEIHNYRVLVLAHRRELITQAYNRIREHCGLDEFSIGCEIAEDKAPRSASVVIGSVMTVKSAARLPEWTPDVIITDEAHHQSASSYQTICQRFPDAILIGCTATAKRGDKQSLYAKKPNGETVEVIDRKTKKRRPVEPAECAFDVLCYEYGIAEGTEDGWLVPVKGHVVQTDTDLSQVETGRDGDFVDGQLAKAVDNAKRTMQAISAWKEIAGDRPTIVFCASVEHAHHSAELWQQAGYTAAALDGESDNRTRYETLRDFQNGEIQVLCNCGLFTEGMDAPKCASIVLLRPTKSWNLYVQMVGRGTRTLPGVIEGLDTPEWRKQAIAASEKPDCMVLDLVDICGKHELCTVPSILDLPANLDLQGKSVTDAKKLLDEFEEVRDRVIGECPLTYQDLEVRLNQVNLLRHSKAKSAQAWKATDHSFRYTKVPPGYQAEMTALPDGRYELAVTHHNRGDLFRKPAGNGRTLKDLLQWGEAYVNHTIQADKAAQPLQSRGTLGRFSDKQIRVLTRRGHRRDEIDCMPYAKAKALVDKYMNEYLASMGVQERELAG